MTRGDKRNGLLKWIEEMLKQGRPSREDKWSSSVGVGSEGFVQKVKNDLGVRAEGRKVVEEAGDFKLRAFTATYISHFLAENEDIGVDNAIFLEYLTCNIDWIAWYDPRPAESWRKETGKNQH